MKKVITYGTYDLLHQGHVNLLRRARELGDYLIVGVTTEDFDLSRGKINVQQSLMERMQAVKDTGFADEVIPEEYFGQKIDDIRRYGIDVFTVGSDWKGKFDYLEEYCEVVYLDRTEGISSTELRNDSNHLRLGIIGCLEEIEKFVDEARYVSGIELVGVASDEERCAKDPLRSRLGVDELLRRCDAVYVACEPHEREEVVQRALKAGVHVLCESPIALRGEAARSLFSLAREKGLVLYEAVKTAYSMAFSRMVLLVKSNRIGAVKYIRATCTSLQKEPRGIGSLEGWGPIACLPIFSILGTDYVESSCISFPGPDGREDEFSDVTLTYDGAMANAVVANGVKAEGDLVVAGTEGYVYVPSPWWKNDYFEVRHEDPRENKSYYYQLDGEGIRFEIAAFSRAVAKGQEENFYIPQAMTEAIAELVGSGGRRSGGEEYDLPGQGELRDI